MRLEFSKREMKFDFDTFMQRQKVFEELLKNGGVSMSPLGLSKTLHFFAH